MGNHIRVLLWAAVTILAWALANTSHAATFADAQRCEPRAISAMKSAMGLNGYRLGRHMTLGTPDKFLNRNKNGAGFITYKFASQSSSGQIIRSTVVIQSRNCTIRKITFGDPPDMLN